MGNPEQSLSPELKAAAHSTRLCKICFLVVMSASVSECLLISLFILQRLLLIYSEVFQKSSDLFF